jgi:hypothetical protein
MEVRREGWYLLKTRIPAFDQAGESAHPGSRKALDITRLLLCALCFTIALGLAGLFQVLAAPLSHAALASPLPHVAPLGTALPTETPPPPCAPAWHVSSSSNTGPDDNVFNAVATISVDDAWVVGYYSESWLQPPRTARP